MKFINKNFSSYSYLFFILILLIVFNGISSIFHTKLDFTNEKRFTLSPSTKSILKNLDSTIEISVLLTGDIKSEFKKLANSTKDLLENFKEYGGNKIQLSLNCREMVWMILLKIRYLLP